MISHPERMRISDLGGAGGSTVVRVVTGSGPAADVVAQAWSDLLGAAPDRPTDDFFVAGGDSLKAVRLVAAIRDKIGLVLPFRAVFDNSTFGELVGVVAEAWSGPASDTGSHP